MKTAHRTMDDDCAVPANLSSTCCFSKGRER
jgi:hypothetical protein